MKIATFDKKLLKLLKTADSEWYNRIFLQLSPGMRKLRNNSRRFAFGYILPTAGRIYTYKPSETLSAAESAGRRSIGLKKISCLPLICRLHLQSHIRRKTPITKISSPCHCYRVFCVLLLMSLVVHLLQKYSVLLEGWYAHCYLYGFSRENSRLQGETGNWRTMRLKYFFRKDDEQC